MEQTYKTKVPRKVLWPRHNGWKTVEIRSNVNPLRLEHRNDNDDALLNDSKKDNFFLKNPIRFYIRVSARIRKQEGKNGIQNINATGKTGEFLIGNASATHSTDVLVFIWWQLLGVESTAIFPSGSNIISNNENKIKRVQEGIVYVFSW